MSKMIERIMTSWEGLPIRDSINPGSELDLLRKREAIRVAIGAFLEELRNFDTSDYTFEEAETIRRFIETLKDQ